MKVHVKSILRKIGVVNRTQAAIWATQHSEKANGHLLANGTLIGTGAASEKLNGDHPQDQAISGLIDERKLSHDLSRQDGTGRDPAWAPCWGLLDDGAQS